MTRRPRVLLAMSPDVYRQMFDAELLARLDTLADSGYVGRFAEPETLELLEQAEVLLTGWGCPPLDAAVLANAPKLQAVIHTAGTVKGLVTQACWDRGLIVTSAAEANAVPVSEYTLSATLAAGKRLHTFAAHYRNQPGTYASRELIPAASNFERTVGIIGFSRIGRRVARLLRPFDFEVLVADPFASHDAVAAAGAALVSLDDLLRHSDIVSLHAPQLPETHHLMDRRRLGLMPDHATLINTARGPLVDTAALTEECVAARLFAFLDVTEPEPLPADSPLYRLPNVVLTPHIAGATGTETRRLADLALGELARYARGVPMRYQVHQSSLDKIA